METNDRQVGLRELKLHTAAVIKRVADGQPITITDRGRPVAVISPYRTDGDVWDQLLAQGRMVAAKADLLEVLRDHACPPLQPGEGSLVDALMELRADER